MFKAQCPSHLALVCVLAISAFAQTIDPSINDKIRAEEKDHSQIMHTMHYLADVYGPRLTGSPNHKAAADWAVKEMTSWGFANAHLEPWEFGHPGWVNERSSGYALSPFHDQLTFKVLAWTPSTNGTVTAQVFQLIPPENRTKTSSPPILIGERQSERQDCSGRKSRACSGRN